MRSTRLFPAICGSLIFVATLGAQAAASLSGTLQAQVRKATFEIVMQKPEVDSLSYEKPLPLDLLPFKERNEKYVSIGSAFAIGDNRFVTAAHVLSRGFRTQFGEPAVRKSDGSVHPISLVHKLSTQQDFVVFSCDTCGADAVLKVNREPALDSGVFAVGNALGEGIIIRDGLLTSMTPETRYGKWKWLRFSAAASPGNSGGPLLDAQGRVIGVVLRKSESENLNYALPIAELLDAPENVGQLDSEMRYRLPFLSVPTSGHREKTIELPRTYAEVGTEVMAFSDDFIDAMCKELLQKNPDTMFPRGDGAAQLLQLNIGMESLAVIAQKEDGMWDAYTGENPQSVQLAENGYVSASQFGRLLLVKIRRPDSADAAQFYRDSTAYMDTLLKGWLWKRAVGRDQVRITSLGNARDESVHVDTYGRKWQVRKWNIEYQDVVALSVALPTPEGYVGMVGWAATAGEHDLMVDLRSTTDFVHISLGGTLRQWQDYLARTDLLPRTMSESSLAFDFGKRLNFRSRKFAFSYSEAQQKILPTSRLLLTTNYVPDANGFTWDVTGLSAVEDAAGDAVVVINRLNAPPPGLPQNYAVEWQKIVRRQQPLDGKVQMEGGVSTIGTVHPYPQGKAPTDPSVLYTLVYAKTGAFKDRAMQAELKKWSSGLQILE